jgi:hypothetical protein
MHERERNNRLLTVAFWLALGYALVAVAREVLA